MENDERRERIVLVGPGADSSAGLHRETTGIGLHVRQVAFSPHKHREQLAAQSEERLNMRGGGEGVKPFKVVKLKPV